MKALRSPIQTLVQRVADTIERRGLLAGVSRLGVAVSEVDGQDTWQRSTLAGALISGSFKQLAQAADHVEAWLLSRYPEGVRMERSLTSFEDAGGIG